MKHIDFEKTMTIQAVRGNFGGSLRDGAHCLICRWWRKPCATCAAALKRSVAMRQPPKRDLDAMLRGEFKRLKPNERRDLEMERPVTRPRRVNTAKTNENRYSLYLDAELLQELRGAKGGAHMLD